jgi:hypothetical protein
MISKYISRDTLDDFFREIGEKEEIDLLAQQKLHTNTRRPLTAACKDSYGASQKAKA